VKLSFVWSTNARLDLRRIERETAMRILTALTRYAESGDGDVKALEGKFSGTIVLGSAIGASAFAVWPVRFMCSPSRTGETPAKEYAYDRQGENPGE